MAWGGQHAETGRGIWIFKRGKLVDQLKIQGSGEIKQLHVLGSWLVGCTTSEVEVWKGVGLTFEPYTTLRPSRTQSQRDQQTLSGTLCTLPTFLNKILLGRGDGTVEIWNLRTGKCIFSILPPDPHTGPVTSLQATPALSCAAIAYASGVVIIHNVEHDQTILSFRQSSHAITSISFRADGIGAGADGREDGVMATASSASGDITFWDLNDGGRVAGILREAHHTTATKTGSGITKIEFLPDQAVLVSTGIDNALKTWIFDQSPFSAIPRPLHSRSGHAGPVTSLCFLPAASDGSDTAGKWLLSAGLARDFWGFSLRRDGQSSELSQGHVKQKAKKLGVLRDIPSTTVEALKAPPITAIACSLNRDGGMGAASGPVWQNQKGSTTEESSMTGWESIVTAHDNDPVARTWFWGRRRAGRWTLRTSDDHPVSSVAISACGTFALVGSAMGAIDMYNLQSGIHRQKFPPKLNSRQAKQSSARAPQNGLETSSGHEGCISGIAVDALNQTVVSCSLDSTVRIWNFANGHQIQILRLFENCAPTALRYNSTSGLISLACDDLCIRILDIETRKTVRELWGPVGRIFDHCFSHDGRWVVSCSMDSVIRVFDLATGHLVDAFQTAACTGLSFSTTGEYLATAHAGSIGINIWSNRTLFRHVPLQHIGDEDTAIIDLRDSTIFENTNVIAIEDTTLSEELPISSHIDEAEQLSEDLLTLSLLPKSRWQTLLHLDDIRARNKPIEPPKAPEKAPFFLSSALSAAGPLKPTTDLANGSNHTLERSHITKIQHSLVSNDSVFSRLLASFADNLDPDASNVMSHLTGLSPSQMDLEIRSLTLPELVPFVTALTARLRQKKDFEVVNSFMACFLRMHGDVVQDPGAGELKMAMRMWNQVMRKEEERLGDLVGYCKGVVEFLRSSR